MSDKNLENSLQNKNPKLAKEWHPTKNGALTPEMITYGTAKKVWWLCAKGHEWEALITNRHHGAGCKYCAGRYRKADKANNFEKLFTARANYWHPTKNGDTNPSDVLPHSKHKAWWICKKGHEWNAPIANITIRENDDICDECKSLQNAFPQIAEEWHPTRNGSAMPEMVSFGSAKRAWWLCAKGHEWETAIVSRTSLKSNCPTCYTESLTRELEPYIKERLLREWHPTKNEDSLSDYSNFSTRRVWWKCYLGHETQAAIASRAYGKGCPKCSPQLSIPEIRVFAELHYIFGEELLQNDRSTKHEFDVFHPTYRFAIEYDGYYWHKDKKKNDVIKNEFAANNNLFLINIREHGLERLSNNDIFLGEKGLTICHIQDIVKKIISHASIGKHEKKRSREYLASKQFKGDEVFNEIAHNLPRPLPSKSLAVKNPHACRYWHPTKNGSLSPEDLHPGSSIKIWWKCEKGHEFKKAVHVMPKTSRSNGCPECKKEKIRYIFEQPNVIKRFHPKKNKNLDLKSITLESYLKVWWQCDKGHEWEEAVRAAARRNESNFCKICRSLPVKFPGIASEWHPTKNKNCNVYEVTYGSRLLAWWRCEKGHEWTAQVKKRTKNLSICPQCHKNTMHEHYADLRRKKDKD